MDIKTLSITELKSIAYDQLANIEQSQTNLKTINAELAERNKDMNEEEIVTEEVTEVATETTEEVVESNE